MKILQVITKSSLGGAQSVVINLSNSLCEKGHEVVVIAGEGDGKIWSLLDKRVRRYSCKWLKRSVSPKNDMMSIFFMRKIYQIEKPDVIHLHSSKAGLLGRVVFPSKKIIYTVHGFDSIRIAFRKFLPIERIMQYRCANIIGVSKHDVRTMKEEGIFRNVSYVYNGIRPYASEKKLKWDVPDKYQKVVLCIARLSPPKKHDLFLEVARLIPDCAFVWIGNQVRVDEHPKNVFFLGKIPNAGMYCGMADVLMLPSNYEGLPMVILEAMSQGVPVVASDVGGVGEAVVNAETGFVVNNKEDEFVWAINKILTCDDLAKKMHQKSLDYFNKKFSVDIMVNGYLAYYNNINK